MSTKEDKTQSKISPKGQHESKPRHGATSRLPCPVDVAR